tara:strand:+ start:196 stop:816 length:621 start_codon:yes stop_codon:yes gene_type:complete
VSTSGLAGPEIEGLIRLLSKLPGLGPRSARRVVLHLIKNKATVLTPLADALAKAAERVVVCASCGNLDTTDPCSICTDERRDSAVLCVIEEVADLWALERAHTYRGRYHVLGGTLSALDGVGPEDLGIPRLLQRVRVHEIGEVILATNATVDGQTTAHYISDVLEDYGVTVSRLAHGVPLGGELNYLDDGTLAAAFTGRKQISRSR